MNDSKIIVILGPTGSGKTGVGVEIAKEIGAEIISADSRAIYRGMDIGTAKPSEEERGGVVHWGIDLVEPGERFTVFDWKKYAEEKILDIRGRGKRVLIVGGTGLYIDALVFNYQFNVDVQKSCSDRQNDCTKYLLIGVETEREELRRRLKERLNKIFVQELFDETEKLRSSYDFSMQAMKSNVYRHVADYLDGKISLEEAKLKSFHADTGLARRQRTWFARNQEIKWMRLEKIKPYVLKYIADEQRK